MKGSLLTISSMIHSLTGITIETNQLAYLIGLYSSLFGAFLVKNKLQNSTISASNRLLLFGIAGLLIFYLVWGWAFVLALVQVSISYLLMILLPHQKLSRYTFIFAMSFLSLCHIYMLYVRYSTWIVEDDLNDFTGPLMIITQRITTLAFGLQDGLLKNEQLADDFHKKYAIRKVPTFPEYFGYMFSFTGILCGPFAFYNDVIPYLTQNAPKKEDDHFHTASSLKTVLTKVTCSMIFLYLFLIGDKSYPYDKNIDPFFINESSFFYRLFYLYLSLFVARTKFYGAWLFGEAIHIILGIGFDGYNEDGTAKWSRISNIKIFNIEFATGIKTYIDNWNIMTGKWIRYVSYSRLNSKWRTIFSFLLSAFWHGFFPGYYVMFMTCHIWLLLQRKVRKIIRPMFQSFALLRGIYAIVTFIFTQLAIAYAILAYVVLEWEGAFRFYKSIWFVGHVTGFLLLSIMSSIQWFSLKNKKYENGELKNK